jgi:hypothetical protein
MMARREAFWALVGGLTMLTGCGPLSPPQYRFRMTVEVATPQGMKTGSSVYQVWAYTNTAKVLPEEHARDWGVKGEAVVIDLPTGPVFALMKTGDPLRSDLAQMSMAALDPQFKNDIVESAGRIAGRWTKARADVRREDWPVMVRFRDINDPRSVERIDPVAIGVKRVVVETTSDPVTIGIEKRLDWLKGIDGSLTRRLSAPDPTNPPFSAQINTQFFSTEISHAQRSKD